MSQKEKFHWKNISFTANQVLAIIIAVVSTMAGIFWVLYTTGSFAPDIELGKEASFNRYAYERVVEEKRNTDDRNQELQNKIVLLSEKLRKLDDGIEKEKLKIELKKLETEERISNKKMEIDGSLQQADATAKKNEAELKVKSVKLELKLKKEIAEIERQTSMVRSCVDATNPGERLEEQKAQFTGQRSGVYHVVENAQHGTKVLSDCLEQYYKEFGKSQISKEKNSY
jgi:hypothetical protein